MPREHIEVVAVVEKVHVTRLEAGSRRPLHPRHARLRARPSRTTRGVVAYSVVVRTATLYAAFLGLVAFNVWSAVIVVWAAFVNRGTGSNPMIFWPAVGVNIAVLVAGVWLNVRVWRRVRPRFASRFASPS